MLILARVPQFAGRAAPAGPSQVNLRCGYSSSSGSLMTTGARTGADPALTDEAKAI